MITLYHTISSNFTRVHSVFLFLKYVFLYPFVLFILLASRPWSYNSLLLLPDLNRVLYLVTQLKVVFYFLVFSCQSVRKYSVLLCSNIFLFGVLNWLAFCCKHLWCHVGSDFKFSFISFRVVTHYSICYNLSKYELFHNGTL